MPTIRPRLAESDPNSPRDPSFNPRMAALNHAAMIKGEDLRNEATASACGLIYVGDQLFALTEHLQTLNVSNHLSNITALLEMLDKTVNDRLIELTDAVLMSTHLVRVGPPSKGDVIHRDDCRALKRVRGRVLPWKWADANPDIDWLRLGTGAEGVPNLQSPVTGERLVSGILSDQTKVRVSFDYYPDEPDPADPTGMSEDEYNALIEKLGALGADGVQIEKVGP
jgi:hypothetical protein